MVSKNGACRLGAAAAGAGANSLFFVTRRLRELREERARLTRRKSELAGELEDLTLRRRELKLHTELRRCRAKLDSLRR